MLSESASAVVGLRKGLLGIKRNGKLNTRFFVLFSDSLDYFKDEEEFKIKNGREARGQIALVDINSVDETEDGLRLLVAGTEIVLQASANAPLRGWIDDIRRESQKRQMEGSPSYSDAIRYLRRTVVVQCLKTVTSEFVIKVKKDAGTPQIQAGAGFQVEGDHVVITEAPSNIGVLASWNAANPHMPAQEGDHIVSVNRIRGKGNALLAEMQKSDALTLEIRRPEDKPQPTSSSSAIKDRKSTKSPTLQKCVSFGGEEVTAFTPVEVLDESEIVHKGSLCHMKKKGPEKRYFVLTEENLRYYKSFEEFDVGTLARGSLALDTLDKVELHGDPLEFKFMTAEGTAVHLRPVQPEEAQPWLLALKKKLPDRVEVLDNAKKFVDNAEDSDKVATSQYLAETVAKAALRQVGSPKDEEDIAGGGKERANVAEKVASKAVLMEGILSKNNGKEWRHAYLFEDTLEYFEQAEDRDRGVEPRGKIVLKDISYFTQLKDLLGFEMKITGANSRSSIAGSAYKKATFCTESKNSLDEWLVALQKLLAERLGESFVLHPRVVADSTEATQPTSTQRCMGDVGDEAAGPPRASFATDAEGDVEQVSEDEGKGEKQSFSKGKTQSSQSKALGSVPQPSNKNDTRASQDQEGKGGLMGTNSPRISSSDRPSQPSETGRLSKEATRSVAQPSSKNDTRASQDQEGKGGLMGTNSPRISSSDRPSQPSETGRLSKEATRSVAQPSSKADTRASQDQEGKGGLMVSKSPRISSSPRPSATRSVAQPSLKARVSALSEPSKADQNQREKGLMGSKSPRISSSPRPTQPSEPGRLSKEATQAVAQVQALSKEATRSSETRALEDESGVCASQEELDTVLEEQDSRDQVQLQDYVQDIGSTTGYEPEEMQQYVQETPMWNLDNPMWNQPRFSSNTNQNQNRFSSNANQNRPSSTPLWSLEHPKWQQASLRSSRVYRSSVRQSLGQAADEFTLELKFAAPYHRVDLDEFMKEFEEGLRGVGAGSEVLASARVNLHEVAGDPEAMRAEIHGPMLTIAELKKLPLDQLDLQAPLLAVPPTREVGPEARATSQDKTSAIEGQRLSRDTAGTVASRRSPSQSSVARSRDSRYSEMWVSPQQRRSELSSLATGSTRGSQARTSSAPPGLAQSRWSAQGYEQKRTSISNYEEANRPPLSPLSPSKSAAAARSKRQVVPVRTAPKVASKIPARLQPKQKEVEVFKATFEPGPPGPGFDVNESGVVESVEPDGQLARELALQGKAQGLGVGMVLLHLVNDEHPFEQTFDVDVLRKFMNGKCRYEATFLSTTSALPSSLARRYYDFDKVRAHGSRKKCFNIIPASQAAAAMSASPFPNSVDSKVLLGSDVADKVFQRGDRFASEAESVTRNWVKVNNFNPCTRSGTAGSRGASAPVKVTSSNPGRGAQQSRVSVASSIPGGRGAKASGR